MKMIRKEKGITLIALVVTIVVLLILAGVSINLVIGNNGIISKAKEAKIATEQSTVFENLKLEEQNYYIEKSTQETDKDLLTHLRDKGLIDQNQVVNVKKIGNNFSTGNGTIETGDIYKVENKEEAVAKVAGVDNVKVASTTSIEYVVKYYDKDLNAKILGELFDERTETNHYGGLDVVSTNSDYFTYIFDTETKTATITGIKDEYMKKGYYWGSSYPVAIDTRFRNYY